MVVPAGAFCCRLATAQSLALDARVLASPATRPARMRNTLNFFMSHLLPFRGERPIAEAAQVDGSFHRVLALDRAGVRDIQVRALDVRAEGELHVRSLDGPGQVRFPKLLR